MKLVRPFLLRRAAVCPRNREVVGLPARESGNDGAARGGGDRTGRRTGWAVSDLVGRGAATDVHCDLSSSTLAGVVLLTSTGYRAFQYRDVEGLVGGYAARAAVAHR